MRNLVSFAALLSAFLATAPVQAQGGGLPPGFGGFDKSAILKRIKEALPQVIENAPEETLELKGVVKITYKKIPTDPKKVGEALGKDLGGKVLPPGIDINQYIGMFEGEITAILNDALKDVGTFEALVELKIKSKTVPVGEHRFGIKFEGERPVALVIFNADKTKLKKPIEIRLKTRSIDLQEELTIKIKEPKKQKKGKEKFKLELAFMRFKARSKSDAKVKR